MASTSYSGVNYGIQMEANHGSITANFYSELTVVRSLARSLHRSLATSLDPFQQVQNELALLVAGLEIAHSPSSLDESEVSASMEDELRGCQENLNLLRKMKVDYDSRDSKVPEDGTLDDLVERLAVIRLELSYFTTTLGFINTTRIRISQEHVVKMLSNFLSNDDSRTKAKTIVSGQSTLSDDQEGWRQLRKELQDTGISPKSFSDNLDLIIAIFQKNFEADMPDIDTVTQYMTDNLENSPSSQQHGRPASTVSNVNDQEARPASIWDVDVFQMFKGLGGRNNHRDGSVPLMGTNGLISYARKGDLEAVVQKLDEGCDVNALDSFGDSALSWAAAQGHRDIVLLLFSKGAKVGTMNRKREGALLKAARAGHIEVLNILMSHEEPIDDSQYHLALGAAAEKGHIEIVSHLLDRGGDPNYLNADDEDANTPLFKAADNGFHKIVRVLLEQGAKPNTLNFWSESAMFAACRSNSEKAARVLLKFGASFDDKAEHVSDIALFSTLLNEKSMIRSDR